MEYDLPVFLILMVFLIAALYSSVGHGGASGYLAVLVLAGFARSEITPVVLVLNIIVAATGWLQYSRAGHFAPRLLLPFVMTSIPGSFIGGMISVNETVCAVILGVALLAAAFRFLLLPYPASVRTSLATGPLWGLALPVGLSLGILAGMAGIGGGVFLSPLLLLVGWADAKKTAAVSAAFIVLNSASSLLAHFIKGTPFHENLWIPMGIAVLLGGRWGSHMGANRIPALRLQQILGSVLLLAAIKLLFSFQ
ncbi:MAG: sulfite exporter TauE/SafE family protein [Nitrospirae bacterium]|nr:sulfite exporter TauE/SafE family protein [Nitrospirota bacterium]